MNVWTEIEAPDILKELANRLDQLRRIPFEELKALFEVTNEKATIGSQEVAFTLYRETEDNGNIEVVLQASISQSRTSFLKRAQVSAEGFTMTPGGEILPLPQGTIYYYK